MLILSHRGYHKHLPENSLEAFQAAIDMGADGVETDLRTTKDDRLILYHNRYVGQTRIRDLKYVDVLKAVGRAVPLAEEALRRFEGIYWNLEIKEVEAVSPTLALINKFAASRRLLVTSFLHSAVEQICQSSKVQGGVLVNERPLESIDLGVYRSHGFTAIVWNYEFVDDASLARSSAAGLMNFAYRVHGQQDRHEAGQRGLDGVITDQLEGIRR